MKKNMLALALTLAASPAFAVPPKLPAFPPLDFKPPKGTRVALPNGILVYLLENHELPVVQGGALVRTGSALDPKDKIGLAQLVGAGMRAGGSKDWPADKMNETLEILGASVETGMGQESGSAGFWCLSKDFDQALAIYADVLKNPAFEPEKVEVERQKILESIRRRNDEPADIARRESRRMLYGGGHPYGWRTEEATVQAVTVEDLRAFHAKHYRAGAVSIALAGDFKTAEAVEKVQRAFADMPGGGLTKLDVPPPPESSERTVTLTPRPVTQAAVRLVQFGFARHHPDYFAFEVMNDILGGNSFVSRLFSEVRSRKGLAYSVGSYYTAPQIKGMIGVGLGTKNESVPEALEEALRQVKRIQEAPVEPDEFKLAVDSIVQSFVFNFQTPYQIIRQRMSLDYEGYPPDYLDTYVDKIKAVTPADVQRVAKDWLRPEKMAVYVVGDPKAIPKPLTEFGPVKTQEAD